MGQPDAKARLASVFEVMALPSLIISILLTAMMMSVIVPLPAFTTDLESFSPDSESLKRLCKERVDSKITPTGHRVYIHVSAGPGENILDISRLSDLLNDMESLESILPDNSITSHINAADAIQRSIDERDNESRSISDFSDWGEILNSILAEEEDCIEASSDERVLATATFAASAMLHTDFEFEQVCEWLDDRSGDYLWHPALSG